MRPFRSVGARLSFALAVVVIGALAIVWVALVPTLERRLEDGKLSELARSARAVSRETPTVGVSQDFVDDSARTANARVVYFQAPLGGGGQVALIPQFDSQHLRPDSDVVNDQVALVASSSGRPSRGFVTRGGDQYAEAHRRLDRVLLPRVLEGTGGNQQEAARRLGIARETLRRRLRELGIHLTRRLEADEGDPS